MLPVVSVCTALVLVLFFAVWGYGTRSMESRLIGDANLLAHVVRSATESIPAEADLTRVFEQIQEDPSVNFVVAVRKKSGEVIAASDAYTAAHAAQVIPFWDRLEQRIASHTALAGQPWYSFSQYQLQHISPCFEAENQGGYFVLLALDTSKARHDAFLAAKGVAIASLAALLTLSVAVAALLQGIVIRRVRKLVRSTPKTQAALEAYESPLEGFDELCRLAQSMASAYRQLAHNVIRQDEAVSESVPAPTVVRTTTAGLEPETLPTARPTARSTARTLRVDPSVSGPRLRRKVRTAAQSEARRRSRRIH